MSADVRATSSGTPRRARHPIGFDQILRSLRRTERAAATNQRNGQRLAVRFVSATAHKTMLLSREVGPDRYGGRRSRGFLRVTGPFQKCADGRLTSPRSTLRLASRGAPRTATSDALHDLIDEKRLLHVMDHAGVRVRRLPWVNVDLPTVRSLQFRSHRGAALAFNP